MKIYLAKIMGAGDGPLTSSFDEEKWIVQIQEPERNHSQQMTLETFFDTFSVYYGSEKHSSYRRFLDRLRIGIRTDCEKILEDMWLKKNSSYKLHDSYVSYNSVDPYASNGIGWLESHYTITGNVSDLPPSLSKKSEPKSSDEDIYYLLTS